MTRSEYQLIMCRLYSELCERRNEARVDLHIALRNSVEMKCYTAEQTLRHVRPALQECNHLSDLISWFTGWRA